MIKRNLMTILKALILPLIFLLLLTYNALAQMFKVKIDVDFTDGNISVQDVDMKSTLYYDITDMDTIHLRPDLRDTPLYWFYWYFRVTGVENRILNFQFHGHYEGNKFGAFGPFISTDGEIIWQWLYNEPQDNNQSFTYSFGEAEKEVRFSMGMPYLQTKFDEFIQPYLIYPYLSVNTLTTTSIGRNVEKLLVAPTDKDPEFKVVILALQHSCEIMTSYVLEGIISSIIDSDEDHHDLAEGKRCLSNRTLYG